MNEVRPRRPNSPFTILLCWIDVRIIRTCNSCIHIWLQNYCAPTPGNLVRSIPTIRLCVTICREENKHMRITWNNGWRGLLTTVASKKRCIFGRTVINFHIVIGAFVIVGVLQIEIIRINGKLDPVSSWNTQYPPTINWIWNKPWKARRSQNCWFCILIDVQCLRTTSVHNFSDA